MQKHTLIIHSQCGDVCSVVSSLLLFYETVQLLYFTGFLFGKGKL